MKSIVLLIIIFLFSENNFAQKIPRETGEIKIALISRIIKSNKHKEKTNRKYNKKNRPHSVFYFNKEGNLLESINYGKHHFADLKLIDKVRIYKYDSKGNLTNVNEWVTDFQKNIKFKYYEIFNYDNNNNLVQTKKYYADSDSIFLETNYWFDKEGNFQGIKFDNSYYYQRTYDGLKRLTTLEQIYNNRKRWEWKYKYIENQRIGNFQTYYEKGKNSSSKEIRIYREDGKLIEKQTSSAGIKGKIKIYYYKNGLIKKIDEYMAYSTDKNYTLIRYTKIKSKGTKNISKESIRKINKEIFEK